MSQEFLRTLHAYKWDFKQVEEMTLRQFIWAWAMVAKLNKEQAVLVAQSARFALADPKDYEKWISTLIED